MGNSESRPSSPRRRHSANMSPQSTHSSLSSFERLPRRQRRGPAADREMEMEEAPRPPLRVGYPYYEEVRYEAERAQGRRKRGLGKRFSMG